VVFCFLVKSYFFFIFLSLNSYKLFVFFFLFYILILYSFFLLQNNNLIKGQAGSLQCCQWYHYHGICTIFWSVIQCTMKTRLGTRIIPFFMFPIFFMFFLCSYFKNCIQNKNTGSCHMPVFHLSVVSFACICSFDCISFACILQKSRVFAFSRIFIYGYM